MIWNVIVQLQEFLHNTPVLHCVSVQGAESTNPVFLNDAISDETWLLIKFVDGGLEAPNIINAQHPFSIDISVNSSLTTNDCDELNTYLPYALLPHFSRLHQRCFAISHFAQSLDGRIASASGDSKWIGNQENLTHAHKMRALCASILVGSHTVSVDQPQLTVRHVSGNHPVRIIIGGDAQNQPINSKKGGAIIRIASDQNGSSEQTVLLEKRNGSFDCQEILSALYQRNLYSVYIEGGSITTSEFVHSLSLDQIQVHISPLVLGSGLTGFQFEGITEMDEAIKFDKPRFVPMGDQVMFIGEVQR